MQTFEGLSDDSGMMPIKPLEHSPAPSMALSRASTPPSSPNATGNGFPTFCNAVFLHSRMARTGTNLEATLANRKMASKYAAKFFYFPARSLALLQPGRGQVVLPRGCPELVELWAFYCERLGLSITQALWVSSLGNDCLEEDFLADEVAISQTLVSGAKRLIVYAERPRLSDFALQNELHIPCDSAEWKKTLGNKGILHPRPAAGSVAVLDQLLPGVCKPRGYLCATVEDLARAAKLLQAAGIDDVLIKPISGSDGEGIEFHPVGADFSGYSFHMGEVLLEEKLQLDLNRDGSIMSVVIHFFGSELFGPACDQLLEGATNFQGTVCPSVAPASLCSDCERITRDLIRVVKPQGPGGVDFLFVDGKPYLTDINCGRFNGGHYPKAFHMQYAAPGSCFVSFKYTPKSSLHEVQLRLEAGSLDFVPFAEAAREVDASSTGGDFGIFPLVHLTGQFGMYMAIGKTLDTCMQLKQHFIEMAL
jgi:hypothetical protein